MPWVGVKEAESKARSRVYWEPHQAEEFLVKLSERLNRNV